MTKFTAAQLKEMKGVQLITMLTAYNYPVARCIERAGIPVILVGDSLAMVELGHQNTRHVTIENMVYHIDAVRRGAPDTHIIGDMTFESDTEPDAALGNAQKLINAGADSIKIEGPKLESISHLVNEGLKVVGHTGLTPQTARGFKQVGNQEVEAEQVKQDALNIQQSGAFMIVLEHIPNGLAAEVTALLDIPTIGIGAGPSCDGQVMVINDAIGMGNFWPPFSKQYAHVDKIIGEVADAFKRDVEQKQFP